MGRHGNVHIAVVWLRVGSDPAGMPVVEDIGREVECRWDSTHREVTGPDGLPISIDATMMGHELEVPVGSAVFKGQLSDLTGSFLPTNNVMRVVYANADDDFRGRDTHRECGLSFAKESIPSVES